MTTDEQRTFSSHFDDFFCRCENTDHNLNMSNLISWTTDQSPYDGLALNKEDVNKVFTKVNAKTVCWPRWCMFQITKSVCSSTLSGVYHTVYNVIERRHCSSCMENFHDLSYSKNNSPSDLSDNKPIAITSVVMKCFEKIVLRHLLDHTRGMQDPFQFA